ncbi:unnamed protein product [Caenorhabditis auriculariae]|uniref:Amino acid transporter n=1 Tax=Caenorhabditis auriculariae TaxID=2777116 RepID=A0A8S1HFI6_9PELO|nr:unnamed protein product [Caenorhabditis auriculariae]
MSVAKSPGRLWSSVRRNLLLLLTMMGVLLGIVLGAILRSANFSKEAIHYVGFPGELFMNMLKAMVLPLIAASIISGLAQLDGKTSGRLGSRAVLYYTLTTTHAVILGIIVVLLVHPGDPRIKQSMGVSEDEKAQVSAVNKFLDLFRNAFPENVVHATFAQVQTALVNETTRGMTHVVPRTHYVNGMNVLGIIVFCIVMGLVISRLGAQAKPLADFFQALDVVITRMVLLIMWLGPIGIPSLIAQKMLEVTDLWMTAKTLAMFMFTVILGLAIQCFITLPLIFFIGTRKNPYPFLRGLGQAILTALGTASSAASLPVTFRCLSNLGIDPRVTKFVLPVGAMDGTALYEATASIFIAQMNGMDLSIGQIITVSITATLASIGAASIPSAGLVTMLIVLSALGLPASDISLIIAVDWFLDRLRTSVNVIGDAFGCGFVHWLCHEHLAEDVKEAEDKQNSLAEVHGVNFDQLEREARGTNIEIDFAGNSRV